MNTESKHKRLSKAASLTIPKDMRLAAGILPGTEVDLTEVTDGILVSKHVPICRFCGSPEKVVEYRGEEICAKCAAEICKEATGNA